MSTVPLSLVGGLWFLLALRHAVSVATAVGFIALAGVAAAFGVVMLPYLKSALNDRLSAGQRLTQFVVLDAVREGAVLRVRPTAMTVAVVLAGLILIMLGHRTGRKLCGVSRPPMVGGTITAPIRLWSSFPPPGFYFSVVLSGKQIEPRP